MPLTVVYEESLRRIYRAPKWSSANLWFWLSETLVITITVILAFESQGFWKKTNTYLEQPLIELSKRCMIVVSDGSSDPFNYYFWSPFGDLNRAQADRLVMPIVEIANYDADADGLVDQIKMDITLRMTNESFRARSVYWMLYYTIKLRNRARIDMTGAVYGQLERLVPATDLFIAADLQLLQRKPLPSFGDFNLSQDLTQFNESEMVFDSTAYIPFEMQRRALNYNYTLQLNRPIERWSMMYGNQNSTTFGLSFHFYIPEQELTYRCGALEMLKWVWIQYLALSVLIRWIFDNLSGFLFQNQVLATTVFIEETKQKTN